MKTRKEDVCELHTRPDNVLSTTQDRITPHFSAFNKFYFNNVNINLCFLFILKQLQHNEKIIFYTYNQNTNHIHFKSSLIKVFN
jgi:hypothetical protein